ncbi:gp8 [Roseobacter phage SIO1]|uniref:Gp8 n=1 Tax=Roseobacter phage SIO1 TaxID=2905867 RepID=Q9G0H7_9CAUD|nr:gp8 [Roseobacter phage SIO1]AAG02591.1 gp8 [Roseobacter phage SIO1]
MFSKFSFNTSVELNPDCSVVTVGFLAISVHQPNTCCIIFCFSFLKSSLFQSTIKFILRWSTPLLTSIIQVTSISQVLLSIVTCLTFFKIIDHVPDGTSLQLQH